MAVMVVGGAGYIGAHVVRLLQESGAPVLVVDDLSTGIRAKTACVPLLEIDVSTPESPAQLTDAMTAHEVSSVIHFAAKKQVGESVREPAWYYAQNVGGLTNVLAAMERSGVRKLVFSSSAAVYGAPDAQVVDENSALAPINPYGQTKLIGEWMTANAAGAFGLRAANLRYFNVAGAGWDDLGDTAALNLVPMVFEKMDEGKDPLIFGNDYPTPDGTCIRDYVHVQDLAEAHLAALAYLDRDERPHVNFNVGTGVGASVREVIQEISRASGVSLAPEVTARRAGDPAQLIADVNRINEEFGWRTRYGLAEIIESAWRAHENRQRDT